MTEKASLKTSSLNKSDGPDSLSLKESSNSAIIDVGDLILRGLFSEFFSKLRAVFGFKWEVGTIEVKVMNPISKNTTRLFYQDGVLYAAQESTSNQGKP